MDQWFRFTYIILKNTATEDEKIEVKIPSEVMYKQYGFKVDTYHAKNGIFRENKSVSEHVCQGKRLMLSG